MKHRGKLQDQSEGKWRPTRAIAPVLLLLALGVVQAIAEMGAGGSIFTSADSLHLEDLVAVAMDRNPQVLAAKDQWEAARQIPSQSGSLPDPVLGFGHFIENVETRVGPQENRFFVAQRIPWLGKLQDRGATAHRDAEAAELDYHQIRHRIRMEVGQSYYDLRWLDMALALLHEEQGILSHMEEAAQVKYATGTAGQQDVLKVQVEQANIQRRILEMQQGAASVRARLAELLDLDPATLSGTAREDPPRRDPQPAEVLLELGRANRPSLGASALRLRSSEETLDLARKAYLPDLTLRLDYIQVGDPEMSGVRDGGKDAVSIGASINLPIWLGKNRAGVREAEARTAASRSHLRGARAQTSAQIHDALAKVRTSLETTRLYETSILPQAEQTFFAAQAAYQTGSVDLLTYLDSERALLNLRVAYQRAVSDLGSNYARLEWAVGLPVDEILVDSGD